MQLKDIQEKYVGFIWTSQNMPDKEDLDFLYNELGLSRVKIGKIFNISDGMVRYYLSKLGINKKYRFDKPTKEILYDLYIVQNLSVKEVGQKIRKNIETTRDYLKSFGIKKDISSIVKNREKTCLEKYGVKNPSQYDLIKSKKVETCLHNHGVSYPTQSSKVRDKINHSFFIKYGRVRTTQVHISEDNFNILSSPDLLKEYIISNNLDSTKDIACSLGIEIVTVNRYLRKYGFQYLIKHNRSSYERDLSILFKDLTEYNTRKYIYPYEIDLYSPEHKIGIEFNGNYWHAEDFKSDYLYHQRKSLLAQDKGIFLYHIFEYEWLDERKKPIIISQLNNLFGLNEDKVYARKCTIKEVSGKDTRYFLNTNHLQGYCNSKINLGLYHNNELVSLMTFGKPRYNKNYQYELLRFCNKVNTSVVGGASKLFKYFINTYKPTNILSYSNIAKTTGKLYETLGFINKGITKPNYVWEKGLYVLPRYSCTKSKLIKSGFSKDKTENQIMSENGFKRLYDCGNIVWEYNTNFKEK